MDDLLAETALEPAGEGGFRGAVSEDWSIWWPVGGVAAGLGLRALNPENDREVHPTSCYVRFPGPVAAGPVSVRAQVLRRGRRFAFGDAVVYQEEKPKIAVSAVLGPALADSERHAERAAEADNWIAIDERAGRHPMLRFPFFRKFEIQVRPTTAESPAYEMRMRFREPPAFRSATDRAIALVALLDCCVYPAVVLRHARHRGGLFAPTSAGFGATSLDHSVHFHRLEFETDWFRLTARSSIAAGGLAFGTASAWDDGGRLLASAGQQMQEMPLPAAG